MVMGSDELVDLAIRCVSGDQIDRLTHVHLSLGYSVSAAVYHYFDYFGLLYGFCIFKGNNINLTTINDNQCPNGEMSFDLP